jgi:hypothetical protein
MRAGLKRIVDQEGEETLVPFVSEKYDEFFVVSKQFIKKLRTIRSAKTINYFLTLCEYLTYNDDRIRLTNEDKRQIRDIKLNVTKQKIYQMNTDLVAAGLLIKDEGYLKIPANIAWYGDRYTKKKMIKSYVVQTMTPNINF